MSRQEEPHPLQKAHDEAYRAEERARRERFVEFKEGAPLIFGPPKVDTNQFALEEWQRLEANKGNKDLWNRILLTWSNKAREIFNATGRSMRERGKIVRSSIESRRLLIEDDTKLRDAFYRMFALVGQSLKTVESEPGVVQEAGRPRAEREILDTSEAIMLEKWAKALEALDPNEILRMLDEDSRFLTMLYEQHAQASRGIAETKPFDTGGEYRLIDVDVKLGPDGKPIIGPDGEPLKINKLNPDNPDYIANLKDLRDFILGKAEGRRGGKKSENRRTADALIWMGIVRNMDWKQKKDLTASFIRRDTPEAPRETEDFLHASILSGVMTKQDVLDMHQDANFAAKFSTEFVKRLDEAVSAREGAKEGMAQMVLNVQKPLIPSFIQHITSFGRLLGSRGIDLGAIIMGASLIFNTSEEFKNRKGKGIRSAFGAVGKGVISTLQDRNFYIGAGALTVGLESILSRPGESWVKGKIMTPPSEQKKVAERYREAEILRNELLAHGTLGPHGLAQYFLKHYDDFMILAEENERKGKPKELGLDDVKISDEAARAMGYPYGKAAQAVVHRLFKICTKDLKEEHLTDSKKLAKYFEENVFNEQPVALQAQATQGKKTRL